MVLRAVGPCTRLSSDVCESTFSSVLTNRGCHGRNVTETINQPLLTWVNEVCYSPERNLLQYSGRYTLDSLCDTTNTYSPHERFSAERRNVSKRPHMWSPVPTKAACVKTCALSPTLSLSAVRSGGSASSADTHNFRAGLRRRVWSRQR